MIYMRFALLRIHLKSNAQGALVKRAEQNRHHITASPLQTEEKGQDRTCKNDRTIKYILEKSLGVKSIFKHFN